MDISIIITTYNAAVYILDTLESIKQQLWSAYEIVIIDDGSTDNTVDLIKNYQLLNSALKINLKPIEHVGRAAALNHGVENAQYDWIAIIDADDLWNKNKLSLQVKYIQHFNLQFLATKSQIFFNAAILNKDENFSANIDNTVLRPITLDKMLYTNKISHSSVIIKKSLVSYNLNRRSQIDYEMFLRLLSQGIDLYTLEYNLTYHRIHAGQSFESRKPLRYALNATLLQLRYCWSNFKVFQGVFVISKLGYYFFLPRRLRFILREAYLSLGNSK